MSTLPRYLRRRRAQTLRDLQDAMPVYTPPRPENVWRACMHEYRNNYFFKRTWQGFLILGFDRRCLKCFQAETVDTATPVNLES